MAPRRGARLAGIGRLLFLAALAIREAAAESFRPRSRKLFPFWGGSSAEQTAANPLSFVFFGIADWGGQQLPPYTTPGQLAVADMMGVVAAESGNHPAFVIAAGDNFYMDGLPGAFLVLENRICDACGLRNR